MVNFDFLEKDLGIDYIFCNFLINDVNVGVFLRDFRWLYKKCGFATLPKLWPKLCQFECHKEAKIQLPLKIRWVLVF